MRRFLAAVWALPVDRSMAAGLAVTRRRAYLALVIAGVVAAHQFRFLVVEWTGPQWAVDLERWGVVLVGAGALVAMSDRRAIGLRLAPRQRPRTWIRYTAFAGIAVGVVGLPVGLALWFGGALDTSPPPIDLDIAALSADLLGSVVVAPCYEELAYRAVVCAGLLAVLRPWPALLVSSVVFALAHYYNPGPTNLIAGLAFGWAFLVSGSLTVPIVWHALGNLFVLIGMVGYSVITT